MTKNTFATAAKAIVLNLHGKDMVAAVKLFSTGKAGWFAGEKTTVKLDGVANDKAEFEWVAPTLTLKIGDKTLTASPKAFSTGSVGWNFSDKMNAVLNGETFRVQVGINVTVIKSKEEWTAGDSVRCQVGCNLVVIGSEQWAS